MATGNQAAELKARATELADRFSTGQKVLMVGVTFAVIVAMVLVMRSASKPDMTALYSNLAPADAAAVTEKLGAEGTAYQLADGGATIMVPRDKVYDLRLSMAAEGLPQATPEGYALLDQQGITASEFSQQVGYQRAMEGELTKTITAMDPVANATVHLAMPKDDVFATNAGKATASVMVRTKPGQTLDTTQVQAIVHLVASSVQKLAPEDVTVADATGAVLAAPGIDGNEATAADMNAKQRMAFEQSMATSIEQMLTPVVGAGKAKVTVSAELDNTQRKATAEIFEQPSGNPEVPTATQETTKNEVYIGEGVGGAGVLGPDGAPLAEGAGATEYEAEQREVRNALNRVVEETKAAPGTVERMSVAVLVDANATNVDEVGQIQNLVTAAAGLSLPRGDTVQVTRMAFGGSEEALAEQERMLAEAQAAEEQAAMMNMIRQGVVVAFLLALFALVYRSMRKAARRQPPGLHAGAVREIPPTPSAPRAASEPLVLERPVVQLPPELPPPTLSEEEKERERVASQVSEMIDQQPAEVAQLLRGWLDDGRRGSR
jgi:flagellar M-ring protein FliF